MLRTRQKDLILLIRQTSPVKQLQSESVSETLGKGIEELTV